MTSDRLRLAAVEEIAAWDLGLAADLIHRWDGTRSKLPDVLRTVGLAPVELADDIGGAAGASEASRPPRAVRSRWDEGRVELWDAQLRGQMPMPGKAPSLEKLIWRAQSRIVMTHLDEQRTRLQGEFIRRASDEVLRGFHADRGDDAVWELGDMHHYVVSRQVQLPRPTQVYLAVARDVRNAIAHGRPAREGDIARLMAGLPTA